MAAAAAAQEPKHVAYPERDILSPFRSPTEVYAPPDKLFSLLRRMRELADDPSLRRDFDKDGREVLDHEGWRRLQEEVDRIGIDASYLAGILRMSKNADDRATALYATFFCKQPDYVLNLISHIPGEPERRAREQAFPRAIGYLKAHLRRRFGDLDAEQKKLAVQALPQLGSPAAKAAGIKRLPRDEDHLHDLRLVPFFQLLDLDEPLDQAQGLWFLKEVFAIRGDLALLWLEPALPRVRQLLVADDPRVREQAIGLLHTIGPKDLRLAAVGEEPAALQAWADLAVRALFPPIRNLNDTIVQLQPSPERDAIVAAGKKALEGDSLGEPAFGKTKDGMPYRGLRIRHVPDDLKPLAIPVGAVITAVNGVQIDSSASALRTVQTELARRKHPRNLLVEYVLDDVSHAVEYRIL
jgi:hypothetical protein